MRRDQLHIAIDLGYKRRVLVDTYAALARSARAHAPRLLRVALVATLMGAATCASWMRLEAESRQAVITGDEGISLLVATCHEDAFLKTLRGGGEPYGHWVQTRVWQRYLRPEKFGCFGTISRDLTELDLHPPLYFAILHLWLWLVGLHAWTFVGLNLVFTLITIGALFALGYRLFESQLAGIALAFIWAASPLPLAAGVEGRPYELLACCTAGFLAQLAACCTPRRPASPGQLVWLASWAAAGVLTHYLFLFVLLGGALFGAARAVRLRPRHSASVALAVVSGLGLASIAHPIARQITNKREQSKISIGSKKFSRLRRKVVTEQSSFYRAAERSVATLEDGGEVALILLLLVASPWLVKRQLAATGWLPSLEGADVLLVPLVASLLCVYLYASGHIPRHAMNAKYLSFLWPLLPLIPVVLVRLLGPLQGLMLLGLSAFCVLSVLQNAHAIDFHALGRPISSPEHEQALAFHTNTWHPTAASIVRRNPDSMMFLCHPVDAAGSLYGTWLTRVDAGETIQMVGADPALRPIVQRLRNDGYRVEAIGRPKSGSFLVGPKPAHETEHAAADSGQSQVP